MLAVEDGAVNRFPVDLPADRQADIRKTGPDPTARLVAPSAEVVLDAAIRPGHVVEVADRPWRVVERVHPENRRTPCRAPLSLRVLPWAETDKIPAARGTRSIGDALVSLLLGRSGTIAVGLRPTAPFGALGVDGGRLLGEEPIRLRRFEAVVLEP